MATLDSPFKSNNKNKSRRLSIHNDVLHSKSKFKPTKVNKNTMPTYIQQFFIEKNVSLFNSKCFFKRKTFRKECL